MTGTVQYYSSDDGGAPSLTGQAGTLANILDKILVDGFNAQSVQSLTQSGGTATATFASAHGFPDGEGRYIKIAGANESAYNGTFKVLSATTTTLTFAVDPGAPSSATGTITISRPPLGWTCAYTDTNRRAFRTKLPGSNGMYFFVDDNQSGSSQIVARIRGYESMSDINTGTGPFPTDAQLSGGGYAYKSLTQDGTVRPWIAVGDDFMLYFFADVEGAGRYAGHIAFGDVLALKPGDAYATCLIAGGGNTITTTAWNSSFLAANINSTGGTIYCPRSYSQLGSSLQMGTVSNYSSSVGTIIGASGAVPFPSPVDNGFYTSQIILTGPGEYLRGFMPGLYNSWHANPLNKGDTVVNLAGLSDKTLLYAPIYSRSSGKTGHVLLDISGPWR